ncbi:hypothetical protein EMIT0347P_30530 [Pseudomonas sp. IT-347P]
MVNSVSALAELFGYFAYIKFPLTISPAVPPDKSL